MSNQTPDNHPSQAEGEDPDVSPAEQGGGSGQTGHPSQAEGGDPGATGPGATGSKGTGSEGTDAGA